MLHTQGEGFVSKGNDLADKQAAETQLFLADVDKQEGTRRFLKDTRIHSHETEKLEWKKHSARPIYGIHTMQEREANWYYLKTRAGGLLV